MPSFNATKQGDVDAEWEVTSKAAAENPGKQYDNAKERIFDENKSPELYDPLKLVHRSS